MASFLLLVSLSSLALLSCCHADLIADICSQSKLISPASCAQILRSDPHSRGADLDTLGQITFKKAKVAVKDTATVAKSILDLNNTGAVSVCGRMCESAIEDLTTVSELLYKQRNTTEKGEWPITLSGAAISVGTCDDAFANYGHGVPGEVEEASRIARGLIVVVIFIVGRY